MSDDPKCRQCPKPAEVVVKDGTIEKRGAEYFCVGCYLNLCNWVSGCHFGTGSPPPAFRLSDDSVLEITPSTYQFPGRNYDSPVFKANGWASVRGLEERKKSVKASAERIVREWLELQRSRHCSTPYHESVREALDSLHAFNEEMCDFVEHLLVAMDKENQDA